MRYYLAEMYYYANGTERTVFQDEEGYIYDVYEDDTVLNIKHILNKAGYNEQANITNGTLDAFRRMKLEELEIIKEPFTKENALDMTDYWVLVKEAGQLKYTCLPVEEEYIPKTLSEWAFAEIARRNTSSTFASLVLGKQVSTEEK